MQVLKQEMARQADAWQSLWFCPADKSLSKTHRDQALHLRVPRNTDLGQASSLVIAIHGNGFCGLTLQLLTKPYQDILSAVPVLVDLRGHGKSSLTADVSQYRDYHLLMSDITALTSHFSNKSLHFIGHSMGSLLSLHQAMNPSAAIKTLALMEPTFLSPTLNALLPISNSRWPFLRSLHPLAKQAARRRPTFPSLEFLLQSYSKKALFKAFDIEAFAGYLVDGFTTDEPSGQVALNCQPTWESSGFLSLDLSILRQFKSLQRPLALPVFTARGVHASSTMPEAREALVQRQCSNVTLKRYQGVGHMLPMCEASLLQGDLSAWLGDLSL